MKTDDIRLKFPGLSQKVYGRNLVYLDNAATSQRPESVIRKLEQLSLEKNANIHRAVHYLSGLATEEYESTRDAVKSFINASSREEIIFTSGATASINLVASSFGEAFIKPGDEIIVSESEHHSNIVPWQLMAARKGAVIKVLPVKDSGELDIEALTNLLSEKTRITCVTHISNVLGIINPIKKIVGICHRAGSAVLVDGAQGIVHQRVDVQDIGCDFYAFSGHKLYASTGTGVLFGRRELLDKMPPYMGGGEMIGTVSFSGTTYAPLPAKFEAGTQNFNAVPTLKPAIELAGQMMDCVEEQDEVKNYVLSSLKSDDRITLYGNPYRGENKVGLFSISVKGAHHEDIALILDKMGIAVRSGQMCAEPLMDRFGVTGMLRASFAPYNNKVEAEMFVNGLEKAIGMLL